MPIVILLLLWAIVGVVGAFVARSKGRSAVGWFVICVLFPIGLLILLAVPNGRLRGLQSSADAERKTCPQCTEQVRQEALACCFCGNGFERPSTGLGDLPPLADPVAAARALLEQKQITRYGRPAV